MSPRLSTLRPLQSRKGLRSNLSLNPGALVWRSSCSQLCSSHLTEIDIGHTQEIGHRYIHTHTHRAHLARPKADAAYDVVSDREKKASLKMSIRARQAEQSTPASLPLWTTCSSGLCEQSVLSWPQRDFLPHIGSLVGLEFSHPSRPHSMRRATSFCRFNPVTCRVPSMPYFSSCVIPYLPPLGHV